ncbi:rod shape-determining protein [Euzebya tangerina]|uniref:rod shape-determining protein n=1 Tax=Euzebya tangerina TaxID=591198 RepID=UPI000E315E62|nr:rod shape-determining protein [Euzebya tangerina]
MGADFAIDLGTANTVVWARRRGIVIREPTVVAMDVRSGKVIAAGQRAYDTVATARRPAQLERPLDGGAVTDFAMTASMLRLLFDRLGISRFSRTGVLISVPSGVTPVERDALRDAAKQAGAGRVYLIEEPMAASIGAGMPIQDPVGSMVVDIGGGNTEVAVISLGGVVVSKAVRVGGFDLDLAVQSWVRDHFDIAIGDRTAEELKMALGRAFPAPDGVAAEVRGRDLEGGGARVVRVESEQIRVALEKPTAAIAGVVIDTLSECPPELAQDVMGQGILLVGGGALLEGLDQRIEAETQVTVRVADNPLDAVITGAGAAIDADWDLGTVFGA